MPRRAVIYFYYLKMGSLIAFPLQGFSAWPIASAKKKKKDPKPTQFHTAQRIICKCSTNRVPFCCSAQLVVAVGEEVERRPHEWADSRALHRYFPTGCESGPRLTLCAPSTPLWSGRRAKRARRRLRRQGRGAAACKQKPTSVCVSPGLLRMCSLCLTSAEGGGLVRWLRVMSGWR